MNSFVIPDMKTPEGRALAEQYEAEKVVLVTSGQQLYAKIKRTSKYYGQGEIDGLFEVFVDPRIRDEYKVQGGPGGQYRLSDVTLWVKAGNAALKIG